MSSKQWIDGKMYLVDEEVQEYIEKLKAALEQEPVCKTCEEQGNQDACPDCQKPEAGERTKKYRDYFAQLDINDEKGYIVEILDLLDRQAEQIVKKDSSIQELERQLKTITGLECRNCKTEIKNELDGIKAAFCNKCLTDFMNYQKQIADQQKLIERLADLLKTSRCPNEENHVKGEGICLHCLWTKNALAAAKKLKEQGK